jgi:hypothetical protein
MRSVRSVSLWNVRESSRVECGATWSYEREHGSVQLDGKFVLLSSIVFSAIREHVLSSSFDGPNMKTATLSFLTLTSRQIRAV